MGEIVADAESKLMVRMRTRNKGRLRSAALATVLSLAWLVVIFGKDIRRFIGGQAAEVAREAFKHESIQIQAQELATAVKSFS